MGTAAQTTPSVRTGTRRPLLWVSLGAALWGTDSVLRRPLTAFWSSAQIVFLEHAILTVLLLPVFWKNRREWQALGARQWMALAGIAWGGSALGTICFTEAIRLGNPTVAVLLQKTQPLFAALLASALLGETLGRRYWLHLAAALGGAWLVTFGFAFPAGIRSLPGGGPALLALCAAGLWGSSTVLGRYALSTLSFTTLTALRILGAAPLLAAIAWIQGAKFAPASAPQWTAVLLMALVPGLLALLAYYRGLGHSRAAAAAIAELSFPATAALLNWTVLGAAVNAGQIGGFVLLWTAILSLERQSPSGTA